MISGRRRRLRTGLLGLACLLGMPSVLQTASSLFLLASFCTLLWRLWTFSELRTCLITDHIHRCYPKLVVRQRCDTSSSWPGKGCAAVILRGGVGIARCGTPSMQ